jgi:hypothetical protein
MANTEYVTDNLLLSPKRHRSLPYALGALTGAFLLLLVLWLLGIGSAKLLLLLLPAGLLVPFLFLFDETPLQRRRGYEGEMMVLELLQGLDEGYTIFNQIRVPRKRSKQRRECDYIVVGRQASFVIEVKHISGEVHLSNQGECRIFSSNGTDRPLKNPVLQNNEQRKALKDYLRRKGCREEVIPILVFVGQVELKMDRGMETDPLVHVVRAGSLTAAIQELDAAAGGRRRAGRQEVVRALAGLSGSGKGGR